MKVNLKACYAKYDSDHWRQVRRKLKDEGHTGFSQPLTESPCSVGGSFSVRRDNLIVLIWIHDRGDAGFHLRGSLCSVLVLKTRLNNVGQIAWAGSFMEEMIAAR
mmetsp:Transcript_15407/g.34536  ORF Transcript_15407/g.34536 Transcript_15407/m.34536 type:complete len:105 (-) Transcript_15407:896-1210(-)